MIIPITISVVFLLPQFPWKLNLAPFTADYLAEVEGSSVKKSSSIGSQDASTPSVSRIPNVISVSIQEAASLSGGGEGSNAGGEGVMTPPEMPIGLIEDDTEMLSPKMLPPDVTPPAKRFGTAMATPPTPLSKTRATSLTSVFAAEEAHSPRTRVGPSSSPESSSELRLSNEQLSTIQHCGQIANSSVDAVDHPLADREPRTPSEEFPTNSDKESTPILRAASRTQLGTPPASPGTQRSIEGFITPTYSPSSSRR